MVKAMNRRNLKYNNIIQLAMVFAIVIALNFVANFVFTRFDLTAEKRYTLSDITKKYIENLDDIVFCKIYLDGDDLPPGFKRLKNSLKETLDEFIIYGGDNIQYEFINPNAEQNKKKKEAIYKELYKRGLMPISLNEQDDEGKVSKKMIFPGMLVTYRDRELPLDLLSNNAMKSPEENLNNSVSEIEYKLLNTFNKLKSEYIPTIGFTTDHGEIGFENSYSVKKALSEFYNIKNVQLDENITSLADRSEIDSLRTRITNKFDLLVIAKPTKPFSEKDKFILDQYIMNGGKILWLIDGVNVSMDSLAHKNFTVALSNDINLDDQFFNYGFRVNHNLLQDLQCAKIPAKSTFGGNGRPQFIPFDWIFFPLLQPTDKHAVGKNIDVLLTSFVSSIDTVHPDKNVKKTVMLSSSEYTKKLNVPIQVSLDLLNVKPEKMFFKDAHQITGLLLEGKFRSNFIDRVPSEIRNSSVIKFKEQSKETKMMVLSDGDIIYNPVKVVDGKKIPYPAGTDKFTGYSYANNDFILNAVNYLLDESGIMFLRNRQIKLRLLNKDRVKSEGIFWQTINTVVPVFLIIILGFVLKFVRKRKYTVK